MSSTTEPTPLQEARVYSRVLVDVPTATFIQFMVMSKRNRIVLSTLSSVSAILTRHRKALTCAIVALIGAVTVAVDFLAWKTDRIRATFHLHESFSTEISGWYGPGTCLAVVASVISGAITLGQAAWHRRPPTGRSINVLAVVVYSCASGWDISRIAPKVPPCGYSASFNFNKNDWTYPDPTDPSSVAQAFLAIAAAIRATAFTSIALQLYSVLLSIHVFDGLKRPWTRQRWIALIQFILVFGASDITLFIMPVYDWYHNRDWYHNLEWYHPDHRGFGSNNDLICLRQWEGKGTTSLLPHSLPGAKFQHILFGTNTSSLDRRTNLKIAIRVVFPIIFAWLVIFVGLAISARLRTYTLRKRVVIALGIILMNHLFIPTHSYLLLIMFTPSNKALSTLWNYVQPGNVDIWISLGFKLYLAFLLLSLAFVVYPAYSAFSRILAYPSWSSTSWAPLWLHWPIMG